MILLKLFEISVKGYLLQVNFALFNIEDIIYQKIKCFRKPIICQRYKLI
jgi:hypothetical protein